MSNPKDIHAKSTTHRSVEARKQSWLRRPILTVKPRVALCINLCVGLLLVAEIFSPTLFTFVWHLRHGNTIKSRGESIFVPPRWTAQLDDANDAELTRYPLAALQIAKMETPDTIFVEKVLPPPAPAKADQYKMFEEVFWNLHPGEVVSGPLKVGSQPQTAVCMRATTARAAEFSEESCMLLGGRWHADFMGHSSGLKDFSTVIQRLR